MVNSRDERGVIVIVLVVIIIIMAVLAALLGMHRQRAPMAANTLKRTQAYYYTEAALYETFNRFRNNTPPYKVEWKPERWAGNPALGIAPQPPTTTPDSGGICIVTGGRPVVRFPKLVGLPVDVFISCRRADPTDPQSRIIVDANYDYQDLNLRNP